MAGVALELSEKSLAHLSVMAGSRRIEFLTRKVMQGIFKQLQRLSPVQLAFIGSLLLSWIAVLGAVTVNRDAAFYLDIGQTFLDHGVAAAYQRFNWPWFSVLLGASHWLTGLAIETCAYLWCALFMAGTCALVVACVQQRLPAAGYWACLIVLAMPALNQFRNDILREFGFWFFCLLALWLVLRWQIRGGWIRAALVSLAVLLAALFRLEALLLVPALALWQLPQARTRAGCLGLLQLNALPLLGASLAVVFLLLYGEISVSRAQYYFDLVDPRKLFGAFRQLSEQFAGTLINKYSTDDAGQIIFFGLLATLLLAFIKLFGPFALPFMYRGSWRAFKHYWLEFRPFAWSALLYAGVLMMFFVQQQFINSRYVSFLNLLVVPLVTIGVMIFAEHFPRLTKALVAIALLVMLSNVISLGAKKTHYVAAGAWVAQHIEADAPVYYDDARIAYYAGRGYPEQTLSRDQAMSPDAALKYRYFLIEAETDEAWLQAWLEKNQRRVLAQFANRKKDSVLIIGE
jgi:hypothetical protein